MDKNEDFELEFDFEKEYGFSEADIMSPEYGTGDEEFDIDLDNLEILTIKREPAAEVSAEAFPEAEPQLAEEDFGSEEDYKLLEDYNTGDALPELTDEQLLAYDETFGLPAQEQPADEAASFEEMDEVPEAPAAPEMQPMMPPVVQPQPQPQPQPRERRPGQRRGSPLKNRPRQEQVPVDQPPVAQPPVAQPRQEPIQDAPANSRRKKRSPMRVIKEDYLPLGICALTVLLCLVFIIGGVVRNVKNNDEREKNELAASEQAASEAVRQQEEAKEIGDQAKILAAGYDFESAIALIDTFTGNLGEFPELLTARSEYAQMQSQMVEISDFSKIPNLSFHVLIADSATAFNSDPYGPKYLQNFVTIDEFSKILEQLYENGYVLVNFDDFIEEIPDASGRVTFQTKSIKLPNGKKPIMITETLVNYFPYMVDGDDDGQPDKDGDGFACKLVVKDGKITAKRINSMGETVYGDYDLVPILNSFIEEHPDFSYRGAKATLAVTGSDGIFGYRLKNASEDEINACKELVQALRDDGYLLACNSFQNISYATINATDIQADLEKWTNQIVPVIGDVDILVYALGSDISDYNGSKYNVMANAGFKYFISNTTSVTPTLDVSVDFVRQYRIMITGSLMVNSPDLLAPYFTVSHILSNDR